MKTFTDYLWFDTAARQEFIRITDEVAAIVRKSGVAEGMVLAPAGLDYRHHHTGEDNADAHLKRTLMGHQVVLPITNGALDLGPWEQVSMPSSTASVESASS